MVSLLIVDESLENVHDLLLACSSGVELATNLREAVVNLIEVSVDEIQVLVDARETGAHLGAQICHVVAHGVEARHCCLAEVAKLAMELCDVAIGRSGKDSGCGGAVFAGPDPPVKIAHMCFQRFDAGFKAVGLHDREPTALDGWSLTCLWCGQRGLLASCHARQISGRSLPRSGTGSPAVRAQARTSAVLGPGAAAA